MRSILITIFLAFIAFSLFGMSHSVGISQTYPSPNALFNAGILMDGDTILIDGGVYSGTDALAVWQNDNLVFMGSVDGIQTSLEADGESIWGKGIWVVAGNNTTVEGIEFSGAKVADKNGAGIRLDGSSLTIRYCHFHHNEMGILTNNADFSTILVEYSEFGYNGFGDGFSHNIYVNHADSFIFRYNYSHHSVIGHTLKSRANFNMISYNRFEDGPDGNSSRLIDLPNGGLSIIIGNELIQGPNAENVNLLGYGLEGNTNAGSHQLYIINNTFVNKKTTNGVFLHMSNETEYCRVVNNVFTGVGSLAVGNIDVNESNIIDVDWSNLGFIDVANNDYSLIPTSSLIDQGTATGTTIAGTVDLEPTMEYVHPQSGMMRETKDMLDVGAHESKIVISQIDTEELRLNICPNPSNYRIKVKTLGECNESPSYKIIDQLGRICQSGVINCGELDISGLTEGSYHLIVGSKSASFVKIR